MAKVLQNFLIGVGLDTEKYDKGAKGVESSLGRMRSIVGITGAAISGAFALAGTAAINAGRKIDQRNLEFEKFRTSAKYVNDYGNAIRAMGGSFDEAAAAINTAESSLASFRQTGELPGLNDLEMAGVDTFALSRTDTGKDFLRELARQMPSLTKEQQFRVQETLGLSNAVMRSLRDGVEELDAAVERAGSLAGGFNEATEAAREYSRAIAELNTRFEGIGNTLAEKVLPGFTGMIDSVGGFIDRNREAVGLGAKQLGENPTAAALATGGGAASATGVALRGIGLRGVGMGLTRLGTPGMVAGGGLLAYDAAKDWDWSGWWDQSVNSARDSWRDLTGQNDTSRMSDTPFGSQVPVVAPSSIAPIQPHPTIPSEYGEITPSNAHGDFILAPGHDPYLRSDESSYQPNIDVPKREVSATPVYAGGEVDNAEAANASPDVIMVKDQRRQAEVPAVTPRVSVQNHLDVKMEVDGRALDSRVTDVIERRERDAMDDVISSVNR